MSDDVMMKSIIADEYKRCAKDPVYFFRKYCCIQHPTLGKIKFNLFKFQEMVLKELFDYDYSIILKSRQLGISTLSAGITLHMMIFNKDKNILVIATKQEVAKNMVSKVRYMYDNLPSWLKEGYIENNKLNLKLKNGSQVKATSSSGDAGRSEAVSMLIVDEAAFIPEIEEIWGSSQQTLATGGKAIVLSTPNGVANWYHREWTKAKENKNKFHTIQLHWSMHPDRDQTWRDEQDLILGPRLAAQECFDGNTRIYTNKGLKKISEICIGNYVLTHTGKFKKVLRIYSHIDDNLLQIHSYNNKNVRYVTKNHPFLTNMDKWNELKNINNEDILKSFPLRIEYDWLNNIPELDLYSNFNPKNFKKILALDEKFYVNDKKYKTLHNRYIQMDYDAGYLIGLYLAEGSKNRLRTVFSFDYNKEKDGWPIRLQKIVEEKFGLKNYTIRYKGSNTCDLEISSEVLSSFIDLFVNGNRFYNKKLTDFAYEYNAKQFYSGIFDGVFRGDGCLTNSSNKKISIASQDLIYDMKYISSLLGYTLSSIRIIDKEYKENYSKKIKWKDKNYNYHDTYVLSFYETKNIIIQSEFTENYDESSMEYSYKNSIFKTQDSIQCKIYIDECEEILPVYNMEVEDDNSYVTEHFIVHNCDADFLASGNTVIDVATLKFYKETFVKKPIEMRGPNKELWVWETVNYRKTYLVSADVARGDGSDYSTAHVIDVDSMTQVAEFKAQLGTKDFGNFLVGLASEYNDALLVIENSTIGWAAIQQIIDRNYSNLFYTEQALKYVDVTKPKQGNKIHAIEKKSVPGFTTSPASRPLIINKLEEYFRNRDFMLYSDRTMNELYAFIWNGQKAEAMKGYNDDLVMALAIGLWVRDTALQLNKLKLQGTKANLDAFIVLKPEASFYGGEYAPAHDQWNIPTGHPGEEEDISKWLL